MRVPLAERRPYAETRALAVEVARAVMARAPELVAVELAREGRGGRVLVDTRQNSARLTAIVPYSLRTTPHPSIAMPVRWSDVERAVDDRDERALVFEARCHPIG